LDVPAASAAYDDAAGQGETGGARVPPDEEALDYARSLLEATREELVRADTKASLLFAASGVAIGALLNGLLGGKWAPSNLDNRVEWMWWLGVVSAASALTCLAIAIYPRTWRAEVRPKLVAYYGDVVHFSRTELEVALAATSRHIKSALVDQVYQVSKIVRRKYRLIRVALWLFAFAASLCIVAVLLNFVVR
jgi:hypothetical protein